MKVLLMSDSHGKTDLVKKIMGIHSDADVMIHCGDLEDANYDLKNLKIVKGNNDVFYDYPDKLILELEGHRVLIIHSHQFYFHDYALPENLAKHAIKEDCDILFFGHTHKAYFRECNGVTLVNPGALSYARDGKGISYAIVYINENDINVDIIRV